MQVIQQRRVVVRHIVSVTEAYLVFIATASSRRREVGSEIVHLEDGVTWMQMNTHHEW